MRTVFVQPGKKPVLKEIGSRLADMQEAVGGYIQAVYPFEDEVAVVCNEEGKIMGLPLNRALRDEDGGVYDILSGDFFVCGLSEEGFDSIPDDLAEKYLGVFGTPERFLRINGKIAVFSGREVRA